MLRTCLFPVLLLGGWVMLAQAPVGGDGDWPREIDSGGMHLVIYPPQVGSWKDDQLEARAAVIVTRAEAPAQLFGTMSLKARTEVDRESRTVWLEDITVTEVNFPTAGELQSTLLNAVRGSVATWPRSVSLDRLLAGLEVNQASLQKGDVLKNDPPVIIFSQTPAVLILLDGEPQYRAVEGTRYTRAINTPALLLFEPGSGTFYLDGGGQLWMTAPSLRGPWTRAGQPPAELDEIRRRFSGDDEKEPEGPGTPVPGAPPAVYVSTVPAELVVTQGEPAYTPIAHTSLLYVPNSENDIFLDTRSQQHYVLVAGRWFRARNLAGPWEWVEGEKLPRDFSRIPLDSPKGQVLASIPGTPQARESVIANEIPQTSAIRRSEVHLDVHYDGPPQFRPMEGTPMEYAVNTASEVIHAEGRYYAVEHGIWFVADSPFGPWNVAEMIPAVIYTIPPSCPLYHLRFVHVYGATPEYIYAGYTPGYFGAFVSDGVVVFGTGWRYSPWCTDFYPFYCYGWPWTWGFGFRFSYWGGGWFWRPVGHYWWYHNLPATHRVFVEHWNLHWDHPGQNWIHGNVNAYSHWPGRANVPRTHPPGTPRQAPGTPSARPDLYAGRNGQVYQHRQDGWYQPRGGTAPRGGIPAPGANPEWKKVPARPELEQQRQSRSLGEARQRESQQRGVAPGVPRTAPPRGMPRVGQPGRGGRR